MDTKLAALDTKLAFSFEQFRREQAFQGGGGSSSDPSVAIADPARPTPLVPEEGDFRCLETSRY